ncbi:uncharacterized protein LOC111910767 isoform X1 [Lactuca sativa]|uniref:Uncharacterized protein n=1 Tax=Lactuca sativa TaxID=4236 RepID=A0A9R1XYE6_LACSA|nr:uncharacterized protein LOC111910767 isoform X1 [Lactuca sativa]KAJ0228092.1 hypothetical protein LSAT_V11C100001470 [Lactuca sativa]
MATAIVTCSVITTLHKNTFDPFSSSSSSTTAISTVSLPKLTAIDGCFSSANSRYFTSGSQISHRRTKSKMEFIVYASDQIGDLLPFGIHLPDSWPAWTPGFLLAVIVPFFTNKWGPFAKFKEELDKVEEAVDSVADRVEEMAEKVEHFVDEIGNELPEGSVLKSTLEKVENIADKIGKDAHMVSDIVDKMDEMEAKVEDMFNKKTNHD